MTAVRDRTWLTFAEILSDAAERIFDITHHNVQKSTLRHWASLGTREFARRSDILKGTHLTALIAGQGTYRLPEDCIRVRLVAVIVPGFTGERMLKVQDEEVWLDGTLPPSGSPYWWSLRNDRRQIVLHDTPTAGGFRGYVVSAANGTHFIGPSDMETVDDFYNTYTVRILSGNSQGDERVIDDYVGSTQESTVDASFSNTLDPGDQFEIYPDTIRIEYIRAGNGYEILPTTSQIQDEVVPPEFGRFETNLAQKPKDWYVGAEIKITGGPAIGERTRVLTSRWVNSTTDHTLVTVSPELSIKPLDNDTLTITDVPNIPPGFHDALVSYVVHKALQRMKDPTASEHLAAFLEGVEEAMQRDRPGQDQEFQQISEYGAGEEWGW